MDLADQSRNVSGRRRVVAEIGRDDVGGEVDEVFARGVRHDRAFSKTSAQMGSDSIASRKYAREQAELLLNMRGMLAQRQERRRFIFGAVQSQVEKPTTVTVGGRDAHAARRSRQSASCLPASAPRSSRRNRANRPCRRPRLI